MSPLEINPQLRKQVATSGLYPECYSTFHHWISTETRIWGMKEKKAWCSCMLDVLQCNAKSLAFVPGIWNIFYIWELIKTNCSWRAQRKCIVTLTLLSVGPDSGFEFTLREFVFCSLYPEPSIYMLPDAFAQSCLATIFNSRKLKHWSVKRDPNISMMQTLSVS